MAYLLMSLETLRLIVECRENDCDPKKSATPFFLI